MLKTPHSPRVSFILIALLMLVLPISSWSMNLPLSKDLTVRLSTLDSLGLLQTVSEITSKTDSLGKIAFDFPTVPSATDTPFLHIQIMDGDTVLRQTIVPSPKAGGNVDVGVSEVTDLQARAILKSATISGRLSPYHLLVAQTIIRTPAISVADADRAGAAVSVGADALSNAIAAEGLSTERLSIFITSIMNGLRSSAALYKKGVDDSIYFDPKVEVYDRGEAFAALLLSLVTAGADASIPLEIINSSFASSLAAVESNLAGTQGYDPTIKDLIRLCLVDSIINFGNYRTAIDHLRGFSATGVESPKFSHIFDMMYFLRDMTTYNQKGFAGYWLAGQTISTNSTVYQAEFNMLANRDLLMMKVVMETSFDGSKDLNGDYSSMMLAIVDRMSAMGGITAGMTPEKLMGILGKPITTYPQFSPQLSSQLAPAQSTPIPVLNAFELAAWSYIEQTPTFRYTPVNGLIDLLVNKPTVVPTFDQLVEPYKSLALLEFDLSIIDTLKGEELWAAEDVYLANPQNQQKWISMATVYQLTVNHRQRLSSVRQNIFGVSSDAREAYIRLLRSFATTL